MDDEKNYVVFFESSVTGERYYGPPMTHEAAHSIADWGNGIFPTIMQWVELIPDIEILGLETEP